MNGQQLRQDMVANAISFLSDSSVNDTPLTNKIQFLESKGMTNAEIQAAISATQQQQQHAAPIPSQQTPLMNANSTMVGAPPLPPQAYPYYTSPMPPPPPPPRSLDWKDYVIMSTTTAGILYGAYQVVSRYVLPKLIPPSQSKLDEDKDAMEREFQRVEAILQKLEEDQTEFIKRQDEKSKLIDEALIEVDAIVKATNEKNLRNEETLKYLKLEIDSIKTTLLKNLDSQKSTISNELHELQKKTDSLKETVATKLIPKTSTIDYAHPTSSPSPSPSPIPPSNLITNNRSTSSESFPLNTTGNYSNLNIPPPSSVPSAKDILGTSTSTGADTATATATATATGSSASTFKESAPSSSGNSKPDEENSAASYTTAPTPTQAASIPAWQLASAHKSLSDANASVPAWQLAAEDK
jgi:peroxin-14